MSLAGFSSNNLSYSGERAKKKKGVSMKCVPRSAKTDVFPSRGTLLRKPSQAQTYLAMLASLLDGAVDLHAPCLLLQ